MFTSLIRKLVPHQNVDFWLFFYFLLLVFIFLPIIFCYMANLLVGFNIQPYDINISINPILHFIILVFSVFASIILIGVIREIYKLFFNVFKKESRQIWKVIVMYGN